MTNGNNDAYFSPDDAEVSTIYLQSKFIMIVHSIGNSLQTSSISSDDNDGPQYFTPEFVPVLMEETDEDNVEVCPIMTL